VSFPFSLDLPEEKRGRKKEISYPVPQEQPPSQHPSPPAQQAPPTASFLEHAHFSQPHFSPQAVQQHLQSAVFLVSFAWSRKREREVSFFFFFSWSVSLNAQRPSKNNNSPIFSAPQAHLGAHPQSAMVALVGWWTKSVWSTRRKRAVLYFLEVLMCCYFLGSRKKKGRCFVS
jgi:hypothetical protein